MRTLFILAALTLTACGSAGSQTAQNAVIPSTPDTTSITGPTIPKLKAGCVVPDFQEDGGAGFFFLATSMSQSEQFYSGTAGLSEGYVESPDFLLRQNARDDHSEIHLYPTESGTLVSGVVSLSPETAAQINCIISVEFRNAYVMEIDGVNHLAGEVRLHYYGPRGLTHTNL